MDRPETVYVYILKGENGKHYTGITSDPVRRMTEHRNGHSRSTKYYGELDIEWMKGYSDRERAREIEVMIKKKGAGQFLRTYGGDEEERKRRREEGLRRAGKGREGTGRKRRTKDT